MDSEYHFTKEQLENIDHLINDLSEDQLIWMHGYIAGVHRTKKGKQILPAISNKKHTEQLTILYGTHTGHSKEIGFRLYEKLNSRGANVRLSALDEYKKSNLKNEKYLFLVVSTHGEGEPPLQAEDFYEFVRSKRAPRLTGLNYSVFALGDKSYKNYCKVGVDFDRAFSKLGAKAILPIHTTDVAYEENAERWIEMLTDQLPETLLNNSTNLPLFVDIKKSFSRSNPYYAEVLEKFRITTEASEKEIYHVEISLGDSGITYKAGDSIGILPNNPLDLVELIIAFFSDEPERAVSVEGKELSLIRALQNKLELTVVSKELIIKYNRFAQNKALQILLENEEELNRYVAVADVYDLLEDYPGSITCDQFLSILRVLYARLYSISSGPEANPGEVHITVASVRYQYKKRNRNGSCSTYLTDQINIGDHIPIFIEKNEAFRLPEKKDKTLIMVGAGTGIAPYRSFLQELEQKGERAKTWLFFGNQRFKEDFLYQLEWQKYLQKGILEKLDVTFSRDQKDKIYVQHRLQENAEEIFNWLENGAHFYICGDRHHMAKDVQQVLLEIVQEQGGVTVEKAKEYLKKLKQQQRLLLDVY